MIKQQQAMAMIFLALIGLAKTASAGTARFDLEAYADAPVSYDTLAVTDHGLTITLSFAGDTFYLNDISDLNGSAAFGKASLWVAGPNRGFLPGEGFFYADFSRPVNSFSVQMGDLGLGLVDTLQVTAFTGPHGTGTNLGTSSTTLSLPFDESSLFIKSVDISGSGIRSVEFTGGSDLNPSSMFYDNLSVTFTAVPLPPAIFIAPAVLLMAWLAGRQMVRKAVG